MRYEDKDGNIITEEPNPNDISEPTDVRDHDKIRELISTKGYDDVLKSLHQDAVRYEKAGDKNATDRALRRIAIVKKSMQK